MTTRTYIAIDLKPFYSSMECVELWLGDRYWSHDGDY